MSIKIDNVSVTPQTVNAGKPVTITITAREVTWNVVKTDFRDWNAVKNTSENWKSVMNYK